MAIRTLQYFVGAALVGLALASSGFAQAPRADGPSAATAPPDSANPRGFLVPESWRRQARTLLDPGSAGLTGGFKLEGLKLGAHMDATYRRADAYVRVHVVPTVVATETAYWKGARVAIVEVERSGSPGAIDVALVSLRDQLKKRELGWGWLRVNPQAREVKKRLLERRAALQDARREAWLGHDEEAVRKVQAEMRERRIDVSELIMAAAIVHRVGRRELAHKLGKRALERATQSVGTSGVAQETHSRARLALGIAAAYAGETQAAMNVGRSLFTSPKVGCQGHRIARALEESGQRDKGRKFLAELQGALPACGQAWALAIDMARRSNDLGRARSIATKGIEARRGALEIHAAFARLELVEGRGVEAVTRAETAAGRGRGEGDGLITLAAVVAQGLVQDTRLEAWAGEAARSPTQASKLALGAMASYGRGDFEGLGNRLGAMRALVRSDHQLSALHAYALARQGKIVDAEATLAIAWSESVIGSAHLAAEAALASARSEDPMPAWKAYLEVTRHDPGPVSRAEIESLVSADTPPSSSTQGREPAPGVAPQANPGGDTGGGARWPWILGGLIVIVGIALSRRGRES